MTEDAEDVQIDKRWWRAVNEEVDRIKGPCGAEDIHKVRVAMSKHYTVRRNDGLLFVKDVKLMDGIAAWSKEVSTGSQSGSARPGAIP